MEHFNRKQKQYNSSEIFQRETFTDFKPRKPKPKPMQPFNHSKKTMTQEYPRYQNMPLIFPRENLHTIPYMSDMERTLPYVCDDPTDLHISSDSTGVLPAIDDKYRDSDAGEFTHVEYTHLPPIFTGGRRFLNQTSTFSTTPTSSKAMRRGEHISHKRVLQSTYCYAPQKAHTDLTCRSRKEEKSSVPKNLLSYKDMDKLKSGNVHYNNILPPIGETYQVRTEYYRGVLCKSDSESSGSTVSSDSIDLDLNSNSEWVGDFFESMRKYFISCDEKLSYFLSRHGDKRRDAVCRELDRYDETEGLADLVRQHVITEMLSLYF